MELSTLLCNCTPFHAVDIMRQDTFILHDSEASVVNVVVT